MRLNGVVLVALLGADILLPGLLVPALPALAADVDPEIRRLKPGVFLYASPRIRDANFSETVVLLIEYGPKGAMGLVIDRPTPVLASELLKKAEALRGLQVYWGGPVEPGAVFGLVATKRPSKEAVPVFEGVFLTGRRQDLEEAAKGGRADERVRVYVGYSGWGAGQLEAEVMSNGWIVMPGEASAVFSPEPEKIWPKAHHLFERLEASHRGRPTAVAQWRLGESRP